MSAVCILALGLLSAVQALSPVVLVPGTGGSQLYAKLDKESVPHVFCKRKTDWYRIWLDLKQLLPGAVDCWADNIRLVYDEESDTYTNAPGVEIRVKDFGETTSVEYLDPYLKISVYFGDLITALEEAGYKRNVSIRAAPYDFRYAPHPGFPYLVDLPTLVEETYAMNNNTPVTLMSHSMGGMHSLYMLNHQTAEWKAKYIKEWILISAVLGGVPNLMKLFATGDGEGVPLVKASSVRDEQRSYESNLWLMPVPSVWGDLTIVTAGGKNYTSWDQEEFLTDLGIPQYKTALRRVSKLTGDAVNPGVRTRCLYSLGVKTPLKYHYPDARWSSGPRIEYGDGDGTVNAQSLEVCHKWEHEEPERHSYATYANLDHGGILKDPAFLKDLVQHLLQD